MNRISKLYDTHLRKGVYGTLRECVWPFIYVAYGTRGHGDRYVEGPALMVGINHESSLDSAVLSYFTEPMSIVFRKKIIFNPSTLAGMITGGIPVRGAQNGSRLDRELFIYRIKNGEVIAAFLFTDVGGKHRKGVVKIAMETEKELGCRISYRPFTIVYKDRLSKPLYIPWSKWPVPLTTSVDIFVGKPISSEGKTLDELLELLEGNIMKQV